MLFMLFVDLENFKKSLAKLNRIPKFEELSHGIFNYAVKSHNWEKFNPRLIRAYAYTGVYTDNLISRLKQKVAPPKVLTRAQEQYKKQKEIFSLNSKFLEFRTKPLKYEWGSVFQKGVDVQLAVDLVSHAHMGNFDVAVLCSGDLDLLESMRAVKNLGKKVIMMSHSENVAYKMAKEADSFINLENLSMEDLDTFSKIAGRTDQMI